MVVAFLHERALDLNGGPTTGHIFNAKQTNQIRTIALAFASLSIVADLFAVYWFARMKRKFRHNLIMILIVADLLKDINFVAFLITGYVRLEAIQSSTAYCQSMGFFSQYLVEVTDFSVLAIVSHMCAQILKPKDSQFSEGGLERFKHSIFTTVLVLPLVMACIAFVNSHGGYQLIGAYCSLPIRPFWYRLTLSWIPRYIIIVMIIVLTLVIRYRVQRLQKKLQELQDASALRGNMNDVIEEVDEIDADAYDDFEPANSPTKQNASVATSAPSDLEKSGVHVVQTNVRGPLPTPPPLPPMPTDYVPSHITDMRKQNQRQSFKRRNLATINTNVDTFATARTRSTDTPSLAPSSAILASPRKADWTATPQETTFKSRFSAALDRPGVPRGQSVADPSTPRSHSVMDMPARRGSLVDMSAVRSSSVHRRSSIAALPNLNPLNPERMSSIHSAERRSSIWDEIDASLEKKASNRMSIFTITGSEAGFDMTLADTEPVACSKESPSRNVPERMSMYNDSMPLNPLGANPNRMSKAVSTRTSMRNSMRQSMSLTARRAMSVISVAMGESDSPVEPADSPTAILQRRHRYIQRQLRYLMFYPICYLLLWTAPLVLHVLQYNLAYAQHPPFTIAILYNISIVSFGTVYSCLFCMREKPWHAVTDEDPVLSKLADVWAAVKCWDNEEELDFQG